MVNSDSFREAALTFKEYGTYCKYQPGSRSYMNYWRQEAKRCLEGYHAGHDYIPGYYYFYLNYSPIYLTIPILDAEGKLTYTDDGKVQSNRILDFAAPWDGDYNYYHYLNEAEKAGQHGVVLKTRGRGYSFKGGSMLNRNFFLIRGSRSFAIAGEKEYLIGDGILTKAWEMMDFINEHTAWAKRRQVRNTELHRRASYKALINGKEVEKGYKSEILGVTLKNDPNRARGKRGKLLLFEEGGKLPGLLQAWQIARSSLEQGSNVFGLMVAFGTGGTEGADFEGLQELFENPRGYNIRAVDNIWDEGAEGNKSGFFVPEYSNLEGYYDADGNSDEVKARKAIEADRAIVSKNTKDVNSIKRYIAEKPMTPREAMMKLSGNMFPSQDLLGVLARLELDPLYEQNLYKGRMVIDPEGNIDFKEDKELRMIYNYPLRKDDPKDAPIIIYEMPVRDNQGSIPYGVYVAGIDPYDHDISTTGSLGSTVIINKLTGRIVAEYTARPQTSKDYYEQVRRLLLFYNARALYENNVKGIYDYFEGQGSLYLLCEEPKLVQDIIKKPSLTRKLGMKMHDELKKFGEGLILQWLLQDYDKDKNIKNYHKIRSIPLLKELIAYDGEKNTDRVMALMMAIYQINEERRYIPVIDDKPKYIPAHKQDFFNRGLFNKNTIGW